MIIKVEGVMFLRAEEKSFKKGEETINYVNATILDDENLAWDLSVGNEVKKTVLEMDERTVCDVSIELYKTKYEGKESIKMRLLDVDVA